MMKDNKIPTLLGIVSVTIGLVAGVLLIKNEQTTQLYAQVDAVPENVRISNITDDSFTVTWTTQQATSSTLSWQKVGAPFWVGGTLTSENKSYTHFFTVEDLDESSLYEFEILSGGDSFDNNGIPWQARTAPSLSLSQSAYTLSGTVVDMFGVPVSDAIVYAVVGGGSPLTTTTSKEGAWFLNINTARIQNLTATVFIDPDTTLVELSVFTGKDAPTSGQLYPGNTTPALTLGRENDFRNQNTNYIDQIPEASIIFPTEEVSGFGELIDTP